MKFSTWMLSFMLISLTAFSQSRSPKELEKELVKTHAKLTKQLNGNYDSLEYYSSKFNKQLTSYISNNPNTMDYPFELLTSSNKIQIADAPDGNFRIYSWDTQLGGSMHLYNNLYQYKSSNKVFTEVPQIQEGDASGFYSEIYTIPSTTGTYYLGIKNGIYSSKDASQSVKAFTIQNSRLLDAVAIFKSKTEKLNEIVCDFDFFSALDHPERPLKLIRYDSTKHMLYIPVITGEGKVTDRFLMYTYQDPYFVYTTIPKSPPKKKR